jgi:peroxin-3
VTPDLRRLLDETSDILESPAATTVLHLLLDNAMQELLSTLDTETKVSRDGVRRLANYLPTATKEAERIAHGSPNRYFEKMEQVEELSGLAAIVYGNWDPEALKEVRGTE